MERWFDFLNFQPWVFEEIGREFGGFAISASRKPSAVNCKARRICFLRQCDCRAFLR
ncbi:hypothetical protein F511_39898 [Dorcoceras hygrometricum]|uniref:Uncharacterized protein n=1 Tax=Dorcoceras hygrometricum TaxID=472368 RepID=A0A2Z7CDA4_9LAMI|nr:hypothetical protein F511_39898 [Dorcoceras hygrometricum]